ncbi:DUF7426 family protein [Microbacterium excoecariae]|uniref:DUF7426 family protein n=1 Tax=Microbacterium excoecariae TaxID=2715210 RepID=UPI00140CA6BC|nr:hypothetical protein [Microbacterium excoecariae]NHI16866.1 hypothetical protein [Microbacterium excoecariae]
MTAVDFGEWAADGLTLTFGGRTYDVRPPSVEGAKQVLAAAVRGEINLGLIEGEIPDEVQQVLNSIGDTHPALGSVYDELVRDGVDSATIDRMGYYAVFYWARGREYADKLAAILWAPRAIADGAPKDGGRAPKGSKRRRTGRRTA